MSETLTSRSPSDPNDEIGRFPVADAAAVTAAVERARSAFPAWRDTPPLKRARIMFRFKELLERNADAISSRRQPACR